MRYPVDIIYVTQKFGENPAVYKQFGMAGHNGIDFRTRFVSNALSGKVEVKAFLSGTVLETGDQGSQGYGKFIRLQHEGTSQSIYGHLSEIRVKKGEQVNEDDVIGITGWSGFCIPANSRGAHLHFGYRPDKWEKIYNNGFKGYVDPLPLLEGLADESGEGDRAFAKKWAGWLVIVPELQGETWYVSPKTFKRYKLSGGVKSDDAAILARDGAWIGMTVADLEKIPKA